jgi:hypothetical protein
MRLQSERIRSVGRRAESPYVTAVSGASAIPLHTLPVSDQCDYNASEADGHRETSARPLKSASLQHQSNVRQMADAPDSKSGPRKEVADQVPPSVLRIDADHTPVNHQPSSNFPIPPSPSLDCDEPTPLGSDARETFAVQDAPKTVVCRTHRLFGRQSRELGMIIQNSELRTWSLRPVFPKLT